MKRANANEEWAEDEVKNASKRQRGSTSSTPADPSAPLFTAIRAGDGEAELTQVLEAISHHGASVNSTIEVERGRR